MLPKDATAEQVTQFRKDNGIPEKPEAYLEALPKDVAQTLSDTDKAIITPYLSALHELNLSPAHAAKLIAVRQAEFKRQVEVRNAADETLRVQTEDALHEDWGNNYRAEINNIHGMLNGAPAEVRQAILDARTADGTPLVGTKETMRWLAQLARTVNPYSVPVGGDGGSLDQKGVDARIAEIDSWMGAAKGSENYKRYYNDPKVQTEYRTLIDARQAMKTRTAA